MRLFPTLHGARVKGSKLHARAPAREPFPFQELIPLKLKDVVSNKRDAGGGVSCLQEMAVLFSCLKNNEFNQAVCSKEISSFQTCYKDHMASKAALQSSTSGIGNKKLTPKQVNALLKKYPST